MGGGWEERMVSDCEKCEKINNFGIGHNLIEEQERRTMNEGVQSTKPSTKSNHKERYVGVRTEKECTTSIEPRETEQNWKRTTEMLGEN